MEDYWRNFGSHDFYEPVQASYGLSIIVTILVALMTTISATLSCRPGRGVKGTGPQACMCFLVTLGVLIMSGAVAVCIIWGVIVQTTHGDPLVQDDPSPEDISGWAFWTWVGMTCSTLFLTLLSVGIAGTL